MKFTIEQDKGYTTLETKITTDYSRGMMYKCSKITDLCKEYEKDVFFINEKGETFDGKNVLDEMMAGYYQGVTAKVKIEGEDKKSMQLALKLASGFNTDIDYDIKFDQYI